MLAVFKASAVRWRPVGQSEGGPGIRVLSREHRRHHREGPSTDDFARPQATSAHRRRAGRRPLGAHGRRQDAARVDGEPLVARVVHVVDGVCNQTVVVTNRPDALAEARRCPTQSPSSPTRSPTRVRSAVWPPRWRTPTTSGCSRSQPTCRSSSLRSSARCGRRARARTSCCPSPRRAPSRCWRSTESQACLPAARAVLATGRRRLVAIFSTLRVAEVPLDSLRAVDPELRSLVNVNTPADLAEARDSAESAAPSRYRATTSRAGAHGGRRGRDAPTARDAERAAGHHLPQRRRGRHHAGHPAGSRGTRGRLPGRRGASRRSRCARPRSTSTPSAASCGSRAPRRCPRIWSSARATSPAAAARASPSQASVTRAGSSRSPVR